MTESTITPLPVRTAEAQPPAVQPVQLELQQHGVCFVLPRDARFSGELDLPGGALIFGHVQGRIRCQQGSLVLAQGSVFAGKAEAGMVYVCGIVRPMGNGQPSEITGSLALAVSATASGRAKLTSRSFSIHSRTFAGQIHDLQ